MIPLGSRILFEDNHLLIINKLPSEIVQGDKTGDPSLLEAVKEYIGEKYRKPGNVFAGLIHRIDRPVSGAVAYARTSKALSRMTNMLRERNFDKRYLAVVRNRPPHEKAELKHFLLKNEAQNKSYVAKANQPGAKEARLTYTLLAQSESFYLLEINLHTGRHHQIRCQLAALNCPVLGDLKYGDKRSLPDASIALHAALLGFKHPVGGRQILIKALPDFNSRHWAIFKSEILNYFVQS